MDISLIYNLLDNESEELLSAVSLAEVKLDANFSLKKGISSAATPICSKTPFPSASVRLAFDKMCLTFALISCKSK